MRVRQGLYLLVISILIVFAAGCGSGENTNRGTSGAFIGGSSGLSLKFLSGAPPASVFDKNNPFSVNVQVENIGEWDVAKGKATFSITGIKASDFGVLPESLTKNPDEDLTGVKKNTDGNIIKGVTTNLEYNNFQYASEVAGEVPLTIRAEACYEYGTRAQTKLCMSKDFLGRTNERGVCDPDASKTVENSGAPVQVTSFKEVVTGSNKVSVEFDVKHVGTGNVYELGTSCNSDLSHQNRIKVTVENPGLGTLTCSGLQEQTDNSFSGIVRLDDDKKATVRCSLTVDEANRKDFEKVLNLRAEYDYKDTIETPIVIKHELG